MVNQMKQLLVVTIRTNRSTQAALSIYPTCKPTIPISPQPEWYSLGLTQVSRWWLNSLQHTKAGQLVPMLEWSPFKWYPPITDTTKSLKRNYLVQIHLQQICLLLITHLRRLPRPFHICNLVARTCSSTATKSLRWWVNKMDRFKVFRNRKQGVARTCEMVHRQFRVRNFYRVF